jgi:hypothetical protein
MFVKKIDPRILCQFDFNLVGMGGGISSHPAVLLRDGEAVSCSMSLTSDLTSVLSSAEEFVP